MRTIKYFLAPMIVSSSVFVMADVLANERNQGTVSHEVHETSTELKQDTNQGWSEAKKDSKELWRDTKSAFNEGVVEGKLEMALMLNKHLNSFEIDIDVDGDKVVLEGDVDSEIEKDLAESIAEGIEGISSVDNKLTVNKNAAKSERDEDKVTDSKDRDFSQLFSDVSTTAAIKTELLANDNIKGMDVDVDTFNNQVTLSGKVQSEAQKSLAESIAKKREGVNKVINNLRTNS
jgi:hyperosmotically inducible periplasmic protein